MQIVRIEGWRASASAVMPTSEGGCPFAGIAIGPESEVGRVRVNGRLLQAGRVLALRENSYRVTHDLPLAAWTGFDTGSVLELMLFESVAELASEVSRPNGQFSASIAPVDTGAEIELLVIPFEGRRQCRVNITAGGTEVLDYRIVGRYWSAARAAVVEVEIDSGTDVTTLSRVYGGTNEAEAWFEIAVYVTVDAAVGVITGTVDAETIGEIGCR
jgi:hypothetical protein